VSGIAVDPVHRSIVQMCVDASNGTLDTEVAAAAGIRIVDTFAAYYAAWQLDSCAAARDWAVATGTGGSASVLGTRHQVTPEVAAFVNGLIARSSELNDTMHVAGKQGAHPSDIIMPLLAVAEHNHVSGDRFLVAVALGYEIFMRLFDLADLDAFDYTCLVAISVAAVASTLLDANAVQIAHAVAIAAVANNGLRRARLGQLTEWKAAASGESGRAGVHAAMLARHGFEGPTEPFTGESGWLRHVGNVTTFADDAEESPWRLRSESLTRTILKPRPACGSGMSAVLAAEKAAAQLSCAAAAIDRVDITTYGYAVRKLASRPHHWAPQNRAEADHSLPYLVGVTLLHGRLHPRLFDDVTRTDPRLLELMGRIEVAECQQFTDAYESDRLEHHSRVTVAAADGRLLADARVGGEHGEIAVDHADAIHKKFKTYAQTHLRGNGQCLGMLRQLGAIQTVADISELVSAAVVTHD
jgi:2-methylcitrate dehydratase